MTAAVATLDDARRLADELLLPAALAVDAGGTDVSDSLDALADAGFYGISTRQGESTLDVVETLASGCLTTTFVWVQHLGVARAVEGSATPDMASWVPRLASGDLRAGVSMAGLLPGDPVLRAHQESAEWRITGTAPWVTGWGHIGIVHVAARTPENEVVWLLVDAREQTDLTAEPVRMVALRGSRTVSLRFDDVVVDATRMTSVESESAWQVPNNRPLRTHTAMALGVASRAATLMESTHFVDECDALRTALRTADDTTIATVRGDASFLALRATAALMVESGARSLTLDHHAQRLAREALFLLVFGGRPAVRERLAERLAKP